jgi:hypothetical protein
VSIVGAVSLQHLALSLESETEDTISVAAKTLDLGFCMERSPGGGGVKGGGGVGGKRKWLKGVADGFELLCYNGAAPRAGETGNGSLTFRVQQVLHEQQEGLNLAVVCMDKCSLLLNPQVAKRVFADMGLKTKKVREDMPQDRDIRPSSTSGNTTAPSPGASVSATDPDRSSDAKKEGKRGALIGKLSRVNVLLMCCQCVANVLLMCC